LRHLRDATAYLFDDLLLVAFFCLIFSIIGVQSFQSDFNRSCIPTGPSDNYINNTGSSYGLTQGCVAWTDVNGTIHPWLYRNGKIASSIHKGYICPQQFQCVENTNPINGTFSFDDIPHSLELVFVIMSSSGLSDIMRRISGSDYSAAVLCEFFFATHLEGLLYVRY
jgi:hypothetical protein